MHPVWQNPIRAGPTFVARSHGEYGWYPYNNTSPTGRVRGIAMSMCVCLSLCVFLILHFSKTTRSNFTKFLMYVARYRGSVLIWRRCDTLCTSGFVDDIMSSHNQHWFVMCIAKRRECNTRNYYINSSQILLNDKDHRGRSLLCTIFWFSTPAIADA